MRAAVLRELKQPLEIVQDIEIPPLREGQLLVKIAYSGVCHSQLMEVRGGRGPDAFLPHLLGHEASGVVVETGPKVTKVKAGQAVILGWIKGQGLDAGGTTYPHKGAHINSGAVSTFSEYSVVSENRVLPMPRGIPMHIAVLFGCAVPTGAGILLNMIQPKQGATIAFFGLGGIGLSALMANSLHSFSSVIAVDIDQPKLDMAKTFGATATINAALEDPVEKVRALTGGKGVDFAVEAAGQIRTITQAFNSVRRGGGRCIFASHPPTGSLLSIDPYELICGKHIEGTWGGACSPDSDIPRLAEMYEKGLIPLDRLITKRYRLDEINEALDDLENRRVIRPLIEIDPNLRSEAGF